MGQITALLYNPAVMFILYVGGLAPIGEGVAAGGNQLKADLLTSAGDFPAGMNYVLDKLVDGSADGTFVFHNGKKEFMVDVVFKGFRQDGQDPVDAGREIGGVGVDEVEFLFHAHGRIFVTGK
jgi:hypothetical protein